MEQSTSRSCHFTVAGNFQRMAKNTFVQTVTPLTTVDFVTCSRIGLHYNKLNVIELTYLLAYLFFVTECHRRGPVCCQCSLYHKHMPWLVVMGKPLRCQTTDCTVHVVMSNVTYIISKKSCNFKIISTFKLQ